MTSPDEGCAWITGASSGIGRAVAQRMARDAWRVVASARSADTLDEMARGSDGRIVAQPCDVTDRDQVHATVKAIEEAHGPIALAVLSAGTFTPETVDDFSAEGFRKMVEVNLMGAVHCVEALLPYWRARGRGHLAIVSSVAGYRGLPTSLAYGSTKAALINLCEGLKFDFDRLGLKVQVINPGFVKTPLTDKNEFPMPFLIEVDDAAERIVRGLKSNRFEIAFPNRFVYLLKWLRTLPYAVYFPLVKLRTGSR